jgi:hypothetical protein
LVFAAVAAIALTASVAFLSCDEKAPATDTVAAYTVAVDIVVEVVDTVAADTVEADTTIAE